MGFKIPPRYVKSGSAKQKKEDSHRHCAASWRPFATSRLRSDATFTNETQRFHGRGLQAAGSRRARAGARPQDPGFQNDRVYVCAPGVH